jgi:hypothetical protein
VLKAVSCLAIAVLATLTLCSGASAEQRVRLLASGVGGPLSAAPVHELDRRGALGVDPVPATPRAGPDDLSTPKVTPLNNTWYYSTAGFTVAPGEPLGPDGTFACSAGTTGYNIDHTQWYRFTGNGARLLVHTFGSDFVTMLAVYNANSPTVAGAIGCDAGPFHNANGSFLYFQSQAGADYLVQVGGVSGLTPNTGTSVFTVLGSDERAFAMPIAVNSSDTISNNGASATEVGEPKTCGATTYGSTLWLKFTVPAPGKVTLTVSSSQFAPAVTVMRGSDLAAAGPCGAGSTAGALIASTTVDAQPGEYYAQIGDVDGDFRGGTFNYKLDFTADLDIDRDGYPQGADCNDANSTIHPGVVDVTNGIDDDCDRIIDPDVDGDGYRDVKKGGTDCDDTKASVHPGAPEVRGNRVDENCDKIAEPLPRIPTQVEWDATVDGSRTTMRTLIIRTVPKGARIALSCKGKGCPSRYVRRVVRNSGFVNLTRWVGSRKIRSGAVLVVRVTVPGMVGRSWSFTYRTRKLPRFTRKWLGSEFPG